MPAQFFSGAELSVLKAPVSRIPQCGACGLYKTCESPKMEPSGRGRRKILVVAEAPGKDEDRDGVQLVGESGRKLMSIMHKHRIDMRNDCILTNSLICRPPNNEIKNRKCIAYCRPNLVNTIEEVKPHVIIPLGATACDSLMGWLWKEDVGGINRWAGFRIPHQKLNAWICPTFHPAHLLYDKDKVTESLFDRHIAAIAELEGRPWDKRPNYEKKVESIFSPEEAARRLDRFTEGVVAFDFETNMLKPDGPEARIVSCSVCWEGHETIAFPWHGAAVAAFRRLLDRRVRVIGANAKFEDRWVRRFLRFEIGMKWLHDVVVGAHVIYNAAKNRRITSVKFQAFVNLGLDDYSYHIEPYLKPPKNRKGGNAVNRIHEIDLKSLLLYNGMDSLVEYKIGMKQIKILKRGVL